MRLFELLGQVLACNYTFSEPSSSLIQEVARVGGIMLITNFPGLALSGHLGTSSHHFAAG
mgnify:FL=1